MSQYANVQAAFNSIRGLLRPNRFVVDLLFPDRQYISAYAESIDIPSLGIGTAEFQYNTQPVLKVPYIKLPAQTCNVTFRVDAKGEPVKILYDYVNSQSIPNNNGDYFVSYLEEIQGTVDISVLDPQKDSKLFTVSLSSAIVTNIDAMQLSFDDRDSYLKQTVTFSYQDATVS